MAPQPIPKSFRGLPVFSQTPVSSKHHRKVAFIMVQRKCENCTVCECPCKTQDWFWLCVVLAGENSQPTMAEAMLPWKRPEDEQVCDRPLRQSEFPPWASNKEYVNYYSPSNTFLGKQLSCSLYYCLSFSCLMHYFGSDFPIITLIIEKEACVFPYLRKLMKRRSVTGTFLSLSYLQYIFVYQR